MNYVPSNIRISCCCAVHGQTTRMPNKLQGAALGILCTFTVKGYFPQHHPSNNMGLSETSCFVYPQLPSKSEGGHAITQAVSCWFPTAAARVRSIVRSCWICGWQSGTGAGILGVRRCPLPILIPSAAPHSASIIRGWYNRPICGPSTKWTQSHPTPRN
jgi:hypothetical protein